MIETLRRRADLLDAYRWVRGEWPVSRLGLDYCDLSCGLIVGADVCIDGLTTLRKHCRRSCIIGTCGVTPYVVMLSYCLGISRGNPERNTA
jgi:hypothetical protein